MWSNAVARTRPHRVRRGRLRAATGRPRRLPRRRRDPLQRPRDERRDQHPRGNGERERERADQRERTQQARLCVADGVSGSATWSVPDAPAVVGDRAGEHPHPAGVVDGDVGEAGVGVKQAVVGLVLLLLVPRVSRSSCSRMRG